VEIVRVAFECKLCLIPLIPTAFALSACQCRSALHNSCVVFWQEVFDRLLFV